MEEYTYDLLNELYDNEVEYTRVAVRRCGPDRGCGEVPAVQRQQGADEPGLPGAVPAEICDVNPAILAALSPNADGEPRLLLRFRQFVRHGQGRRNR